MGWDLICWTWLRLRESRRSSPSRCGLFLFMMIVPAAVSPVSALADKSSAKFPGKTSNWNGFVRYDFQVGGRSVLVVSPDEPVAGKPWVWHGEFFGHKPAPDIELLKRGFHVVYTRIPDMLGAPPAVEHWDLVYQEMTKKYGLADKVALVGLSRGGLYCYNWAVKNPEKVACIYGDAPVCDFKSWPGGQGDGRGSQRDWGLVLSRYGFESDAEANEYLGNPVDTLQALAKEDVPLLHVHGDADQVVPWNENTGVLARRYRELGGRIQLIQKPGLGHHPHGLLDPSPIVEFIVQHASLNPPPRIRKKKLDPVDQLAIHLEPDRKVVYRVVDKGEDDVSGKRELLLHVFQPDGWESDQRRPCFLVIHGGGWTGGEPRRMYPFASHFARLGMVGMSVQYRLLDAKSGTSVLDAVSDVRSALDFIRSHHSELGIDRDQIVVSGGSAGGHLAASTAMFENLPIDEKIRHLTSRPKALVLLFPVIDTSANGYGQKKIGEKWKDLSPLHNVTGNLPTTLLFHGTSDTVTPFSGAEQFVSEMHRKGNECELVSHEGGRHGYLMFDQSLLQQTLSKMESFLEQQSLLPVRPLRDE